MLKYYFYIYCIAFWAVFVAGSKGYINNEHQVKEQTLVRGDHGSAISRFGDSAFVKNDLWHYFSSSLASMFHHNKWANYIYNKPLSSSMTNSIAQHEATILYLKLEVIGAPEGSIKRMKAQKMLDAELSHRKCIDRTFQEIAKALFGDEIGHKMLNSVRPVGQPIVDDRKCFKMLVETHKTYCGALSTYGLKYMQVFANMCNAGVHQYQLAKVAAQVCGNISN